MARYTGPKRKLERRHQASLFGSDKWEKRPGAPGEHPFTRSRPSEYAVQLREVQKVKRMYGVLEKQFRRIMQQAMKSTGNTGTRLLQLLEQRLDNVVYRLGFAKTRMQARQFVNHRHIRVNGDIVDIASFIVSEGDKIEINKKILESEMWKIISHELKDYKVPEWLSKAKMSGKILKIPKRSELDQSINERLIIEYYSR